MAAAASSPSSRWLYGPFTDLLLGCGLWYFIAFEIFAVYGAEIRLGGGLVLAPLLMLMLGVPHHGATLLRVYEHRRDRRAYTLFAVHASILVWALFAVGVHSDLVGSIILTVFLTWSPWHYTGQNYGIAVMFLRRNGVPLAAHAKRWLHASFILSYLLTVLVMHHGDSGTSYTPLPYDTSGYNFFSLQIPWARHLFLGVGGAYLVCVVATLFLLRRRGTLRQLAPCVWMMASQALWFSLPVTLRSWNLRTGVDVLDNDPEYYFLWIGVAHAVQYLWITSYYARAAPDWSGPVRYFGKAALAGAAVWTLPSLIFAPGVLGRLPFDAGLAALVAATVNLQHFILDGAIWKLRDGRVARILIRSVPEEEETSAAPPRRLRRGLCWTICGLCAGVMALHASESYFGLRRAVLRGDLERVGRTLDRFAWLGRDNPQHRLALGGQWLQRGEPQRALGEFERALQLRPSAEAWRGVGVARAALGRWDLAAVAYETALAMAPADPAALLHDAGAAWLEAGDPERARASLERALALDPNRAASRRLLEDLERAPPARRGHVSDSRPG